MIPPTGSISASVVSLGQNYTMPNTTIDSYGVNNTVVTVRSLCLPSFLCLTPDIRRCHETLNQMIAESASNPRNLRIESHALYGNIQGQIQMLVGNTWVSIVTGVSPGTVLTPALLGNITANPNGTFRMAYTLTNSAGTTTITSNLTGN
jgi:hypothetical protein